MAKNLSSSINKIERAERQIHCCLKDNNYIGVNRWNNTIIDNLKYLEEDVEIFLSDRDVYESDRKMRLNIMYGIIILGVNNYEYSKK